MLTAALVAGELVEIERKTFTATAAYGSGDRLLGQAVATWIAVDPQAVTAGVSPSKTTPAVPVGNGRRRAKTGGLGRRPGREGPGQS
jgi:hypothetical protein